jgi:hypothetical protein
MTNDNICYELDGIISSKLEMIYEKIAWRCEEQFRGCACNILEGN